MDITQIRVCVVCAHLIANGEYDDGEDTAEVTDKQALAIWGDDLRYMCLSSDPDCGDHDDNCECGDAGFSWSGCDRCGSTLGGDRFHAVVMK